METAKVQHVSKASSDELLRKFAELDDGTPAPAGPSALLPHASPLVTRKRSRRTVSAGDEAVRARRRRKSKGGLAERKSLLPISNRRPTSVLRKMGIRRPEDGAPGIGLVLAVALEKTWRKTVEGASKVFVEKHCHKHVRLISDMECFSMARKVNLCFEGRETYRLTDQSHRACCKLKSMCTGHQIQLMLGHELVIAHFSHPHPLELTSLHRQPATSCAGCSRDLSDRAYSCKTCGYALDVSCAQMPQRVRHPADASHSLTLLTAGGSFRRNACGADGSAFFYHCGECNLNLHCSCAAMPLSVVHAAHLHPLTLFFFPHYENRGFSCDICGNPGSYQWVYSCAMCGFDAHVGCATAEEAQANPPWHDSEGGGSAPHLALQKMETGVGVRKIDKRKAKRIAKRVAVTVGTSLICTIL